MLHVQHQAAAVGQRQRAIESSDSAGRYAAPGLWRYSPALLLVIITLTDAQRAAPADLWGLVRMGQDIVGARHIIGRDPYSYAIAGLPWRNHEWLSCVVLALAYNWCGVMGLNVLKLLCTAATIALLSAGLSETGAAIRLQTAILVMVAVIVGPFMQFRPQIFTYLLLSAMLALLARDTYRGGAGLAWTIPMMALWANLHGGFVVGAATMITYGAACLIWPSAHQDWRHRKRLLAVIALALLATLLTPYGAGSWLAVWRSLRSPGAHMAITEWQPTLSVMFKRFPETYGATLLCFIPTVVLLGGLLAALALRPKGGDKPLLIVAALLTVGAFVSMRNIPLGVIGIVIPLARHSELWLRGGPQLDPPRPRHFAIHQTILALLAIAVLYASGLFAQRLPVSFPYPRQAVAYMRAHSLSGHILDDVNWGGYLIWHCPRTSRVFIDNRFETVFPEPLIQEYLHFLYGQQDWPELLNRYHHDFVLVGVRRPVYRLLRTRPDWVLIYLDSQAALFAPRNSSAAAAPGLPFINRDTAAPGSFP